MSLRHWDLWSRSFSIGSCQVKCQEIFFSLDKWKLLSYTKLLSMYLGLRTYSRLMHPCGMSTLARVYADFPKKIICLTWYQFKWYLSFPKSFGTKSCQYHISWRSYRNVILQFLLLQPRQMHLQLQGPPDHYIMSVNESWLSVVNLYYYMQWSRRCPGNQFYRIYRVEYPERAHYGND